MTFAFLASSNIYALDWVAAEKMGLEPSDSFVMHEALRLWGKIDISRHYIPLSETSTEPWSPWNNVRPLVVVWTNFIEQSYGLVTFLSRLLAAEMDRTKFPEAPRGRRFFTILHFLVRLFLRKLSLAKTAFTEKAPSPRRVQSDHEAFNAWRLS